MIKAVSRISLRDTIGFSRLDVGISTIIANEDLHIEADFSAGRIGDAFVFKKTKGVDGRPSMWEFAVGIPTANIKSFIPREAPKMELTPDGKPEAKNP